MGPSYPTPPAGLCADCRHARTIPSHKGAVFVMCGLAQLDPGYPKYPVLPVLACPGYEAQWHTDEGTTRRPDRDR